MPARYRPGWFTRNAWNPLVAFLTRSGPATQGFAFLGARVLAVKEPASGQWQTAPVNLFDHDGNYYLVSAHGDSQWASNLRAAGTGELRRVGRASQAFRGRELADDEKVPVLHAYLKRWKEQAYPYFEGIGPHSGDEQIQAIAPQHPVFEVLPAS